jgi:hypothetical protein
MVGTRSLPVVEPVLQPSGGDHGRQCVQVLPVIQTIAWVRSYSLMDSQKDAGVDRRTIRDDSQ